MADRISSDLVYTGEVIMAGAFAAPANSIGSTQFKASDPLVEEKQEHRHHLHYGQSGTATAVTVPLFCPYAGGAVLRVVAALIAASTGNAVVTVDVKKNGTTILSAAIEIDESHAAREEVEGVVLVAAFAEGDVFEAVVTATAGTGALGTGLLVQLTVQENSA